MMIIAVIHCMREVALSFLDTFAEFQKDCIISNLPTGLYFVFQYFSVTLPYTLLTVTLVHNTIYAVPFMML